MVDQVRDSYSPEFRIISFYMAEGTFASAVKVEDPDGGRLF